MAKRLRRKKVGMKHFGPYVDITDPGYDKNELCCRMNNIKIVEGEYSCIIWKLTEKFKCEDGEEITDTRVARIGIYLDGVIPLQVELEQIGEIGVDAGRAGFFMDKPDYDERQWQQFCESTYDGKLAYIRPEGFFSDSGYGDGRYPVVAVKNDAGEITSLEIIFL